MLSIIQAAGWPIWPLIIASIISLTIIGWHLWTFNLIAPKNLLAQVQEWIKQGAVNAERLAQLEKHSYLGQIFAAGLKNAKSSREVMQEEIEETGRHVAHEIEQPRLKYGMSFLVSLNTLGTIASVSPLLGLLGTVIGMVEIFGALTPTGGSPAQLAHGISVALYNTAMGLIVAIPSMIFYRYFRARAEALVLEMEQQAIKLLQIVHGQRK
ncbi:MotA/TolQ/ExbB proton channel [Sulfuricella denitrificans skB26]|uniref:MotA/TolQ/ExbB proton channel n=1 Tax=Sulfuricella denitrificans (strain DSM 22764 / NBRC 105220 / skB26) TaxID=1163617 RepID=S6AHS8_SULDS|nr:MotA/TolQ/ExbB proton channel family protein [Sulfuricella denitrificans]BAN35706.1 MotA/TolQ/ExbB proton channel [Sulfuricella denitrificans skB26]